MISLDKTLEALGHPHVHYDLGKASNINYYTGLIFEAYVEGVGTRILSGGSYNKLIGKFGKEINAIGFSIKIDELLDIYEDQEKEKSYLVEYPVTKLNEALSISKEYRKKAIVKLKNNDELEDIRIMEVDE